MSDTPNSSEQKNSLQGADLPVQTTEERVRSVEMAFDYRGDVTIQTRDGRTLEGYIFDRRSDEDQPYLRLMLASGDRERVLYDQIVGLSVTGRDTAAGKSWETWVKKYVEKKMRGESASIESEPLE